MTEPIYAHVRAASVTYTQIDGRALATCRVCFGVLPERLPKRRRLTGKQPPSKVVSVASCSCQAALKDEEVQVTGPFARSGPGSPRTSSGPTSLSPGVGGNALTLKDERAVLQ